VFDYTQLGAKGSPFFGKVVWDELIAAVPAVKDVKKSLLNFNLAPKLP
jgi:hypothetical protein